MSFYSCGCGGETAEERAERIRRWLREIEEESEPIPVELPKTPERIPVDWPVRREEEVESR